MNKKNETNQEYLDHLRHSCAHLLAASVVELYPQAKLAIGPSIENGFYYDIDFGDTKISEDDFPKIEEKMHELIQTWESFEREELDQKNAKSQYKENPYKEELIDQYTEKGKVKVDFYKSVGSTSSYFNGKEYWDLCKGGHVNSPSEEVKYFKLLSVAGAYWRGDEKNKMLTRIYGTCFPTQEELDNYLNMLEEAKKRDHKKLGRELELFTFSPEVGQGLTLWLPKGSVIRREIENFMVSEQVKMGYKHVYSPHIGQKSLWEKSGHWDLYREKMYSPMDVDGIEYLVKPMTCPMHIQSFEFKPKSYRDLPYKIAEVASVYRYEQSGELSGLLRVRSFTQDDAHIFCTPEQAVDEFIQVFNFIKKLYSSFGFDDYTIRLGIRSKKEKYLGNDAIWQKAEEKILEALKISNAKYIISKGDAAFYGPKVDFVIKDALGRQWQCGTVQIDFMLPDRFKLEYVDSDGKTKTPVMIHRAPLGSLERFLGILIEHYSGAFPVWLSPVQAKILPISEKHLEYGQKLKQQLLENGIRVELDERNESLGNKIRNANSEKVPYMLILGDKEIKNDQISIRNRQSKTESMQIDKFIDIIKDEIEKHQ